MAPEHTSHAASHKLVAVPPVRRQRRPSRRIFVWFASIGLVALLFNVWGNWLSVPQAYAAPTVLLKGAPSTPNRLSPTAGATSQTRRPQPAPPGTGTTGAPQVISHTTRMPMKPGTVALQADAASSFVGSDGKLELRIPAGAITAEDLAQAGGKISLRVTQIAPASGSSAGGSGEISLGSYLVQLIDAQGRLFSHGLRKPLTALYHLGAKELGLGLEHAHLVLNGSISAGVAQMQGVVQPAQGKALPGTLGAPHVEAASLDLTARTLSASPLASTPSTSMSWDSDSPVAAFGQPDPTSVNLSSGSLSYSLPINIPEGPGGLTPPVNLSYSSESVNEQHNASAAAGWVGEGWSLSVGQISWAEHNVLAGCSNCSGPEWENVWFLSDPYGTSSQLIPPNINVSTFYDDTPNFYCDTGNTAAYPCPILWHTATESHDKIYAYVGNISIPNVSIKPPCFRAWLPNGLMEEFGCTADSLQYYLEAGVGALITGWYLDMITDPQGNQIHFTYQRDMENWTSPTTGTTYSYPRDVQLSTISYDSPGCHNAQTMCTGSAWAPLVQIVFSASHAPAIRTGAAPSGCNTGSNMRCDDPVDLSGSNGFATSLIQSTFVLNSIQVQVRGSGTGSWNTLRTYKLGYEQSGPSTNTDPASGLPRSIAGYLDLTRITEIGSDGSTALPTVNLGYTSLTNYYEDSFDHPTPSTNCGPSWNTGSGSGCPLWSESYAGNNRFLSTISNGQGLSQSFSWKVALNNSHGVPGGGANNADPFYCTGKTGYPCDEADDMGWSHVVLTSESETTVRLTQNGQGGQQTSTPITETTNYSYQLAYPLTAQQCQDCVAGMYWGNQNDGDYLNYYNAVFMGFAQATVYQPTGAVEVHNYYAGEGWGIYDTAKVSCFSASPCHNDPWWATANAAHGQEFKALFYDTDGTTLLRQVDTTYSVTCPPPGVSGTPASSSFGDWDGKLVSSLDHNNPVAVCSILKTQQSTQTFDGASSGVSTTTSWTYDNYGRVTQQTVTSSSGTPATTVTGTAYVWNDSVTATRTSATGTYIIDTPAFTDTKDASGNRLACTYTSYDGQDYLTGQTSALTGGLATTTTRYADCGTSANGYTPGGPSTTTTVYDVYGNAIATNDPDANAGVGGHTGCSVNSVQHTTCTTYDSTFKAYPTASGNALNQTTSTSYANTGALFGFGIWPVSTTDANNQTTSYTYDALGRTTSEILPGETAGESTRQWAYTNWCNGTAAQAPCEEIDEIDRLDSGTTTVTRAFYDGQGRLVETRTPGPIGQDVVTYAYYDSSGRQIFKSNPYFVKSIGTFDWSKVQFISGDFNGDGKVDELGIYDLGLQGNGKNAIAIFEWLGTSSGLSYQGQVWSSLGGGGFTWTAAKWVSGDFNGDGKDDLMAMYDMGSGTTEAIEWLGSGSGFSYQGQVWQASGFTQSAAQFVAGDFNGDGKADVMAMYNLGVVNGKNAIGAYEWLGTSSGVTYQGQIWNSTSNGGFTWANADWVAGDFNGDGKDDIMAMYDMGNASTEAIEWLGASAGLTYQGQVWQASGFTQSAAQFVAGDFNGDGKADVMAMYNLGNDAIGAYEWLGTTSGLSYQNQIWNSTSHGGYDWTKADFVAGDFTGDHKADIIGMYNMGVQQGLPAIEATEWVGASSGITYEGAPWDSVGTDLLGAASYSIPDSTQPGTSTSYPNLRTTKVTDPNSHTSTTTASVICGVAGTSDPGCYVQSMLVDANGHQSATLTGGLGKTNYTQTYTGTSGNYSLYATTTSTYDEAGNLLSTKSPDGSVTTATYDALGRVITQSDPDRGTTTLTYDPNGNLIESVDARASAGTLFTGYDGLNRPLWQNSTNSSTGALVTFSYDSTASGNMGIGRMTGESFTGSSGLSGSYAITYDGRGRQTGETITINGTSYSIQASYNDAGQVASQTYPTGEVVTPGYDANGWLINLSTKTGSTVTTLASNLAYSGLAGASGKITAADFGNGDTYTAGYDTGLRLTSAQLTQASTSAVLYSTQPAYDAANNVVSVQTSIGGATDTQQFCYDSLNRLTWSGTSGTPPCSGASFSGGTLTGAGYQQSDSYTVESGLTTGPAGSYTYGDSKHPHAVTSTSGGYSAAYDAVGNLICRAPNSATTCSGSSPNGQQLSYDAQGRLSTWESQPTSPAQSASYLYDGSGNRVAMQSTVNGTTTLTAYIGSIEQVQTSGGSTTTTTYYALNGTRIAAKVNGTLYYFGYDGLGSQVVVLNNSGNLVGSRLYGPYGNPRYSSGTLPTSIGFTGQLADSVTGLDYYNARYYDPVVGQFLSADLKQGNAQGMNPYAYVGGNPETKTDPTGQYISGGPGSTDSAWVVPTPGTNTAKIYIQSHGKTKTITVKLGRTSATPPKPPKPPKATVPPDGGNDDCGKLSQAQCSQAQQNRNAKNQAWQTALNWTKLGVAVINAGIDIYKLWHDWNGWDFGSMFRWFKSLIGLAGDVATLLSTAASVFNIGWLKPAAGVLSIIANTAATIYQAATSSWWGTGVLVAGYYTIKAVFTGLAPEEEFEGLAQALGEDIVESLQGGEVQPGGDLVTNLVSAGLHGLQAAMGFFQQQIDQNNSKPLYEFYP